ncbi:venom metalloproteinase antarease TserMP_A-like [Ornithodoros turicata]|uniref:venom metalloproteinase antarease TserMP_A-like n=1 Tax=Ornithodoros turicata TaxID=34597 RepID=UPI00313A198E
MGNSKIMRLFFPLIAWSLLTTCSAAASGESTIVFPRILESRGDDGTKVLRINDELVLNLEPSSVFSDVFMVHTFHDGISHKSYHDAKEFHAELYQDPRQMASVMVTETDYVQVEGVLGSRLRIRPAPELERSLEGHVAHIMFSVEEKTHSEHGDYASPQEDLYPEPVIAERSDFHGKTMYPEVHVVVQYDHAKAFGFNKTAITRYFAIFLNVVNLRYKSMNNPKVQIRIVGLTINKRKEDEPYVVRDPTYKLLMDTGLTMNGLMEQFRKYDFFLQVDIVFFVTALDMIIGEGPTRTVGVSGYAFCGSACTQYKFGESEDTPLSYDGTHLFAHEVAHTLGCVHDEDPPDQWVSSSHPGAQSCPWKDGYIMSYVFNDTNHYKFSPCCMEQMRHVFSLPTRKCLHEKNWRKPEIERTTMLPSMNAKKFCKIMHGWKYPKAYPDPYYDTSACKLQCVAPRPKRRLGDKIFTHYAIDGSSCDADDNKKVCVNGRCLNKSKWFQYINTVIAMTPER